MVSAFRKGTRQLLTKMEEPNAKKFLLLFFACKQERTFLTTSSVRLAGTARLGRPINSFQFSKGCNETQRCLTKVGKKITMPRTCLACASSERREIDKALVSGEPLRNIAKRVSLSTAALFRHKPHVSQAIVKANEKREEKLGDNLLEEMQRVQRKAWELLGKMEAEGDHRGSVVALREVRECMESLGEMLAKAEALKAGGGVLEVKIIQIGAQ
jgi:transposase